MNKVRLLLALTMAVLLVSGLILASCAPKSAPAPPAPAPAPPPAPKPAPAPAAPEYKWRLGSAWVQKVRNESLQLFCDIVGVYSGGKIKTEFYPGGALGTHSEIFKAVREGTVEMGIFAPYVDIVPGGMLNWMPWTVASYDEAAIAYNVPDGIIFQIMTKAWDEVGFKLINASFTMGLYGLGNKVRPLKVPDDMKGLKMRVSASLGFVRTMENMGKGTGLTLHTLPWAEVYSALERGVVDMCWSLWGSLVEERHAEVLKYYTALDFGWDCNSLVMNKALWEKLPPDLKDAVIRAGKIAEERDFEAHRRADLVYMKKVAEMGVKIYRPTPEERELWRTRANMLAIWKELCDPWLEKHYPGQEMSKKTLAELDRIHAEVVGR